MRSSPATAVLLAAATLFAIAAVPGTRAAVSLVVGEKVLFDKGQLPGGWVVG